MARSIHLVKHGTMRHAHAGDMMSLLGLRPGGHLPVEGMAERIIDGYRVYVAPKLRTNRAHRIIAICPCGRHIPAGRLHQHKCEVK